jgi:hypothetical protein
MCRGRNSGERWRDQWLKELETINVIHLQSTQANSEQHKDKDIVWSNDLLKREKFENNKQEVHVFENKEQESFTNNVIGYKLYTNKCIDRWLMMMIMWFYSMLHRNTNANNLSTKHVIVNMVLIKEETKFCNVWKADVISRKWMSK